MQPPRFWSNPPERPGAMARILSPLAALAAALTRRRLAAGTPARVGVPVICVGNINIGGTGKTPTVIALVERLKARGITPHVVSRGYGGTLKGPVRVDPRTHKAAQVGDEPLLLAAFCPVWVARDRAAGARNAAAAGAGAILLDDGFQNPALHKDLSLVVVDAEAGFGNGRVFPSGPLREPVETGLARADMVMLIGPPEARNRFKAPSGLPVVGAELKVLETGMDWAGRKFLAFAGIGRPAKFFATLRSLGAELIHTEALADHQKLDRRLLERMEAQAFFKGGQLVTTEKDAVRLPEAFRLRVVTLPVRLHSDDWSAVDGALDRLGLLKRP
jgi:tetraacyldisaccharide 4'-kinase